MYYINVSYKAGHDWPRQDRIIEDAIGKESCASGMLIKEHIRDLSFSFKTEKEQKQYAKKLAKKFPFLTVTVEEVE